MLAEAREEIQAYEAQSHKPIQGWGWPKATKPLPPRFTQMPMGLDYSLGEFQQRMGKNRLSDSYDDNGDQAPRRVALDKNNSASSFLKGRYGVSDEDKMLASLGTTQRTVSSIPSSVSTSKVRSKWSARRNL